MNESLGMAFSWVSGDEEMVVVVEKLVDVVLDSSSVELRRGGWRIGCGEVFLPPWLGGEESKRRGRAGCRKVRHQEGRGTGEVGVESG